MNIDAVVNQILNHAYFLRLKNVTENHQGWHDNEKTYDHSLKTKNIAEKALAGDFIENKEAKKLFLKWADRDIHGVKQRELSILIALLHDCGKILSYKEGESEKGLIMDAPNAAGEFMFPAHEYWGAKIVVPELLKDISLPEKAKEYIAQIVELHGFFSGNYFPSRESWSIEQIISDVKAHYAGYYIEGLFNMYCDGFTASAFALGKKKIEELFDEPSFYIPRTYFIQ